MVALPRTCERCGASLYHYGACPCAPPQPDPRDAEITRLRAVVQRAYEAAEDCYAGVLGLPHCEPDYCRCGRAASSPPEDGPRTTARRLLKPLFDRPVSPEERAVCDAVTDEIALLRAEAVTARLAALDYALAVLAREGDAQAAHGVLAQEAAALRAVVPASPIPDGLSVVPA
jgi:hypothetical protein